MRRTTTEALVVQEGVKREALELKAVPRVSGRLISSKQSRHKDLKEIDFDYIRIELPIFSIIYSGLCKLARLDL